MQIITPTTRFSTWQELKTEATLGSLDSILRDGDKIPVSLTDGTDLTFVATTDAHGKWYFVLEDCYPHLAAMNPRDTAEGLWERSQMRHWLQSIYDKMPEDLKAAIVPTTIIQAGTDGTIVTQDKLFLLSATQVFGTGRWSEQEPDDTRLEYFKRRKNRVKIQSGTDLIVCWWLRSAYSGSNFCNVTISGSYNSGTGTGGAISTYGVVFGFCINL